ncbi:MAG: twin-arginine translocation signal domain-containing protein, partial [Halapricum sp.]
MSEQGRTLTRRNLLKTGGAAAGAAALGGCLFGDGADDSSSGELSTAFGNCWMCSHNCGQKAYVRRNENGDGTVVNLTGVDGHPRGSAGPDTEGT